jgi:hypothetical protein
MDCRARIDEHVLDFQEAGQDRESFLEYVRRRVSRWADEADQDAVMAYALARAEELPDRRTAQEGSGADAYQASRGGARETEFRELVDRWPSVLTPTFREYLKEEQRNPRYALWLGCELIELTLRLLVFLGLGALRARSETEHLPQDLLPSLQRRIEEPTLGQWLGMAEAIAQTMRKDPEKAFPELPGHVDQLGKSLNAPAGAERTEENSLLQLRNVLAHGGGMSRSRAENLQHMWREPLEEVLWAGRWLADVELLAVLRDGEVGLLRGDELSPRAVDLQLPVSLQHPSSVVARRITSAGDVFVPLWPLVLHGPPRVESWSSEKKPTDPVLQLYVRRGVLRLHYTPLGSAAAAQSDGDEVVLAAFMQLFDLVAAQERRREKGREVLGFKDEIARDAAQMIGRAEERETLRNVVSGAREGLVWVEGPAGIGKTYLMAWLVQELFAEARDRERAAGAERWLVLPYRFRGGDDRCRRNRFLTFARERLADWTGLSPAGEAEEKRLRSLDDLKALPELLKRVTPNRVIGVLDGLDELLIYDPRFAANVLSALQVPGVLWVCAGRPEAGEAMRRLGARNLFVGGLGKMCTGDIRAMILEKAGPLGRKLIKSDAIDANGEVSNTFINVLEDRADGLPLYVRYVVADMLAGRIMYLEAADAYRLPPTLEVYHDKLIERCGVGDEQLLKPLFGSRVGAGGRAALGCSASRPHTPAGVLAGGAGW